MPYAIDFIPLGGCATTTRIHAVTDVVELILRCYATISLFRIYILQIFALLRNLSVF